MSEDLSPLFKDPEHYALYVSTQEMFQSMDKRIRSLERWRWLQAGGAIAATWGIGLGLRVFGVVPGLPRWF